MLSQLVAVSQLVSGLPVTVVPQVFSRVRARARTESVTGVMVFDGTGFCLYLEGARDAVLRCHEAGAQDLRHTPAEVVCHGPLAERRYGAFFSGYALAEGLPASEQLRPLDDPAALARFLALATDFDLNF